MKNTWEASGMHTYPDGTFGVQSRRPFIVDLERPSDRRIILEIDGDTKDPRDCQRMIALAKRVAKLPLLEQAAREVIENWEKGDLAAAVRSLSEILEE